MKGLLIFSVLFFAFCQLKSQTVRIGQDAAYIKHLIEWSTNEHNKPDSYGRYSDARANWDVLYYDGQITNVIQCITNQVFIDLKMRVNFCKHYIMEDGRLAYILTQYENVSTNSLVSVYDELYGDKKINNLYFDDDYQHYSQIYLSKNGHATIEWRRTELSQIPSRFRHEIENMQKEIEIEQLLKDLAAEKEEQRGIEITSQTYDLAIYDISVYNSVLADLKAGIINYFLSSEKSHFSRTIIPTYNKLINGDAKKFRFANVFNAYYKLENHSRPSQMYGNVLISGSRDIRQIKEITCTSGTTDNQSLFDAISIRIPTIEVEGYEVMTEARFENISVDYIKGITLIKIKNGNVEYLEYAPDDDLIEKFMEKLKNVPKGKYIVKYEYHNIMGDENLKMDVIRENKKFGTGWLLVGLLVFGLLL
jgi:hypothetical protein